MKKVQLLLIVVIIAVSLFSGCTADSLATIEPLPIVEEQEPPQPESITITLVGDIMVHNTQLTAAYRPETDSYDFSEFFKPVQPIFQASDLVIGNLETTLAGAETGYTGYPRFNTPESMAGDLKKAGFDVVTTANNHSMDRGTKGITATLQHLDEAGLLHTGTFATKEDQLIPLITEVKGCKIAILSYTYGLNGHILPKDTSVAVNMLDPEQIKRDIQTAKEHNAQLIMVALHFGNEYRPTATTAQQQLAKAVIEAGADVIIGHHPHVLEPIVITDESSAETKLISYSLGNFVSAQVGVERKSSIILNLHYIFEPESKEICLDKASYIPIWTHQYKSKGRLAFRVVPIEAARVSTTTSQNDYFTPADIKELDKAWQHVQNSMENLDPRLKLYELQVPLQDMELFKGFEFDE